MVGVRLMASPVSVGMRFGPRRAGGAHRAGRDAAPRSSCVLGPCGDLDQRLRPQPAWPPLSVSAATDQTRPLEDLQMTGDGREADRERLGQLEHGCLTVSQPTHDRAPRRVRQGREDDVEPIGGRHGHRCRRSCRYFIDWLFNRMTTYSQDARRVEHPALYGADASGCRRTTSAVSSARLRMPVLVKTCSRCVLTVERLMRRRSAISGFECPWATRWTTLISVGVRLFQPCRGRLRSPRARRLYSAASRQSSARPSAQATAA